MTHHRATLPGVYVVVVLVVGFAAPRETLRRRSPLQRGSRPVQRLDLSTVAFAARMSLPEPVDVAITVGYLGLLHRRDLRGRAEPPQPSPTQPIAPRGRPWVRDAVKPGHVSPTYCPLRKVG